MSVLSVNNIGKAFLTYHSEWQRFGRWFGITTTPKEETWTLRHLYFEMQKGEAIGIIGQNGAGKSTLLKIIAGTLKPTEGDVSVNGRIAAILELGMGFNPDLSGRENVRHTAAIMGFTISQIEDEMPSIEEFAEIGQYFDEPVRTYSSGMQMRLAFSVATAWRPEILIVDEALSVGDTYFQHKSFAKIREFKDLGTSLLIVSHDKNAIQTICSRAILLESGKLVKDGTPEAVFDFYIALTAEKNNSTVETKTLEDGSVKTTSGTGEAKVESVELINSEGVPTEHIWVGESVEFVLKVRVEQDLESLVLGIGIKDRLGQVMFGTNTWHTKQILHDVKAGQSYVFKVRMNNTLGVGSYSLQTALHDKETHLTANYQWLDYVMVFEVVNSRKDFFLGSQWINASFESLEVD